MIINVLIIGHHLLNTPTDYYIKNLNINNMSVIITNVHDELVIYDIIIYLYCNTKYTWSEEDKELNFMLDVKYDDIICNYDTILYKINGDDDTEFIFSCIYEICNNIDKV